MSTNGDGKTIRAMSLWQPWATLVALGVKRLETRTWLPPSDLFGGRLLICAGINDSILKLFDREDCPEEYEPLKRAVRRSLPMGDTFAGSSCLPLGRAVAIVTVDGAFSAPRALEEQPDQAALGDFRDGRFAWFFSDVEALKVPFRVTGKQRIFNARLAS